MCANIMLVIKSLPTDVSTHWWYSNSTIWKGYSLSKTEIISDIFFLLCNFSLFYSPLLGKSHCLRVGLMLEAIKNQVQFLTFPHIFKLCEFKICKTKLCTPRLWQTIWSSTVDYPFIIELEKFYICNVNVYMHLYTYVHIHTEFLR